MNVLVSSKKVRNEKVYFNVHIIYEYEENGQHWITLVHSKGMAQAFNKKDFRIEVL